MSQPAAARTPGATRAGAGEYVFDLAKVNHILGGPDYSTANGACVEGDRMIVAPDAHAGRHRRRAAFASRTSSGSTFWRAPSGRKIGDQEFEAKPGSVRLRPVERRPFRRRDARRRRGVLHRKDASHSLHGIKAA